MVLFLIAIHFCLLNFLHSMPSLDLELLQQEKEIARKRIFSQLVVDDNSAQVWKRCFESRKKDLINIVILSTKRLALALKMFDNLNRSSYLMDWYKKRAQQSNLDRLKLSHHADLYYDLKYFILASEKINDAIVAANEVLRCCEKIISETESLEDDNK